MMPMLPATASYLGLDVSARMVALTSSRLSRWTRRAQAQQTDGTLPLPVSDRSADQVISTYVFDLLDEPYAEAVLDEFARILRPDGRLCLASLAFGVNRSERLVSAAWNALWRRAPRLVGGCRPIRLAGMLKRQGWQIRDRRLVHAWGLVTEIVIAAPPDPVGCQN
jgi:ubiquinone/menaquinone biosynthesis C-methylase UbiE